jgi:hypothetical protein
MDTCLSIWFLATGDVSDIMLQYQIALMNKVGRIRFQLVRKKHPPLKGVNCRKHLGLACTGFRMKQLAMQVVQFHLIRVNYSNMTWTGMMQELQIHSIS